MTAGRYDDSEAALYRQVDVREVDELLKAGMRQFARDSSKIVHLLTRVRFTLVAAHDTINGTRRQMNEQSQHLARVGTPTTLNPLDAVKYLDDEQKERIFDRISRERLQLLSHLVSRAQGEQKRAAAELAAVRDVAKALAQMTDLPPHVRAEVTRLLTSLPQEVSPVHYPPMLDYPELAPDPRFLEPEPGPEAVVAPSAPPASGALFEDPYAPPAPQGAPPAFVDPYSPAPTFGDAR